MIETFPLEVELAETIVELNRARWDYLMSERAEGDGRVTHRGLHRHTVRKKRERVEQLEAIVADLQARVEEEEL